MALGFRDAPVIQTPFRAEVMLGSGLTYVYMFNDKVPKVGRLVSVRIYDPRISAVVT